MNTVFWIIVASLIILALAILILPLLQNRALDPDDHRQRNIDIARQRLADLKQQLQDGVIDRLTFDEQYTELQLMLSDDLQATSEPKPASDQGRWVIAILLLLIPGISLLFYQLLGEPYALAKAELQATQTKAMENIDAMVAKLEQRLKAQPGDLEGWMMLGRSFSYMQQYQKAADAFAELYRRQPENLEAMMQYANNLAMARNGRMAGEPAELITKVLERDPGNPNALWLAGMAKAEAGDYAEAAEYWQKLLAVLPPDSESRPQVQQTLDALKQEMNKSDAGAPSVAISIQADISPELRVKLPGESAVFVYAQAVNGPKMPLAIARKRLADLPFDVTLSDAQAMRPGTKLGSYAQLKIVARVSKSGQAISQPGDLLGSTEIAAPFGKDTVTVLINEEVK
ncbi:MAG: c-type cytochrome biogenesis protein CcmI [Gammaproteobacteria bacterium]